MPRNTLCFILLMFLSISTMANIESDLKEKIERKIINLGSGKGSDLFNHLEYEEFQKLEAKLVHLIGIDKYRHFIVTIKSQRLNQADLIINFLKAVDTFNSYSSALASIDINLRTKSNKSKMSSSDDLFPVCVPRSRTVLNIYYINGMFNTRYDALSSKYSLMNLKGDLQERFYNFDRPYEVRYHNLINPNESSLIQLAQVAAHKLKDQVGLFWQYIYTLEKSPEWFKKNYIESILKKYSDKLMILPNDSLGNSFFNQVNGRIQKGELVILVSHSQGNFYANYIYRKLLQFYKDTGINDYESFLGNFQVASPAVMVASQSYGSTLRDDDFVIGYLANFIAGAGDINEIGHLSSEDFLNHSFTKAYLGNDEIKTEILDGIADIYSELITYGYRENHVSVSDTRSNIGCEIYIDDRMLDENYERVAWMLSDSPSLQRTYLYSCNVFKTESSNKLTLELSEINSIKKPCTGTVTFKTPSSSKEYNISLEKDDEIKRKELNISLEFGNGSLIIN